MAGQLSWLERRTHKPEVSGSIPLPATISGRRNGKQDWAGYEEEHAQFDNQILDINKKLVDIEKNN